MVDLEERIEEVIKAMLQEVSFISKGKREELGNESSQDAATIVQGRDYIYRFQSCSCQRILYTNKIPNMNGDIQRPSRSGINKTFI